MGDIARALGTPSEFQYQGRVYKISPWTYGILGEFEVYLQDCALRTMKRMKKFLDTEDYAALAAKTRQEIDIGLYTFGSKRVQEALDSHIHFAYLVMLCLRENHPDVTLPWVQQLLRDEGEMIASKVAEANSDPNQKTPVQS